MRSCAKRYCLRRSLPRRCARLGSHGQWMRYSGNTCGGNHDMEGYLGDHSPITQELWKMRNRESALSNPSYMAREPQETLLVKRPADSRVTITLPFSTDATLRQQYLSPFGHVRMGRLLEDLDAFAGNIAFRHVDDNNEVTRMPTIVTASVDQLDLESVEVVPTQDLVLSGNVTYVGRSSMEVRIDAKSVGVEEVHVMTAYVTMAARDRVTGKSKAVNRLEPETEEDAVRYRQAEEHMEARKRHARMALSKAEPTEEERLLIHRLMMGINDTAIESPVTNTVLPPVPIQSTIRHSMILCQPQSRNIHNTIFGGYLMRKAFELGFCCAYTHCGKQPYFDALGDVSFLRPIEVGALLDLTATAIYVEGNSVEVQVTARVHKPELKETQVTNHLYFTFSCWDTDADGLADPSKPLPVPPVIPDSYRDAMLFIEGRRMLQKHNLQ